MHVYDNIWSYHRGDGLLIHYVILLSLEASRSMC